MRRTAAELTDAGKMVAIWTGVVFDHDQVFIGASTDELGTVMDRARVAHSCRSAVDDLGDILKWLS